MRLLCVSIVMCFAAAIAGCQNQPGNEPSASPAATTEKFPEPNPSPEKTAFDKLAAKKKEYEDKHKSLTNAHREANVKFEQEHPGVSTPQLPGEGPAAAPPSEEVRKAQRELGQIRRKQRDEIVSLAKEYVNFMKTDYCPTLVSYGEFCHKAYLADPSKANGGELFRIADLLYENENVDQAYQYCQDLLKNKFESVQFDDLVAATAYRVDQFDQAEEFEAKASKTSANTRISNIAVKSDIQQCKKAWEKEKEIRAKEAAANDNPRVKIETEVGDIVVELFENEAPENVANYISLVKSGYYDNTEFYSVILAASIFHGSKNGSNNSSPGYKIYSETDSPNRRFPFRGALTMFMQKKDEGGSIYTMALKPSPHLDGFFQTTFGRIVEGFDVLPKIAKYNMRFSSEFPFCGMEPTKVTKVTVLRDRGHEYAPRKVEAGQPATTPASN